VSPGFPAADGGVRTWFGVQAQQEEVSRRAYAFVSALFSVMRSRISNLDDHIAKLDAAIPKGEYPKSPAGKFRLLMTHGQTYDVQNSFRTEFYEEVLKMAKDVGRVP
jgi:hypothetical protein